MTYQTFFQESSVIIPPGAYTKRNGLFMNPDLIELIIRYSGDPDALFLDLAQALPNDAAQIRTDFIPLLAGFAVLYVPPAAVPSLLMIPSIFYIETPSTLFYAAAAEQLASCIPQAGQRFHLTGRGTLIGIADSGIDLTHPDFQNPDGSTRILSLWDQTVSGSAPTPYNFGAAYSAEEINSGSVPERDDNGHGTAVAGIAAGNGRASGGVYRGVAPESELIIVKLGIPQSGSFPRTSQLIMAVDYMLRQAMALNRPLAVNLSFGNNYGAHNGTSITELYLDTISGFGKLSVITGAGNEGNAAIHASVSLRSPTAQSVEFAAASYQTPFNLQLWYSAADQFSVELEAPSGLRRPLSLETISTEYSFPYATVQATSRSSTPYNPLRELFLTFYPSDSYLDSGIWKLHLSPARIRDGEIHLWLSGADTLQPGTRFLQPDPYGTVTIPGTARSVITVGAYNSNTLSYADFSGRGFQLPPFRGPDLIAPGVLVPAPAAGGGYATFTGTSFAAPFVTGSAALLMEWGIVQGNRPFLYGEQLKGALQKGAVPLSGNDALPILPPPNAESGYGRLCLSQAFP